MAKVNGPPGGPPRPPAAKATLKAKTELRARNAAGKQAHSAPKSQYMRPHRVHTEGEEAAAFARHRAALLETEAAEHAEHGDAALARGADDEDEDNKLKGVNLDERRKKRGRQPDNPDSEEDDSDDGEAAARAGKAAVKQGFAGGDGAGKYFQDMPADRLGDLSLSDPNEMKRQLGPSVRFAQHAMLLAEERMKSGGTRGDALELLANLYVGVSDKAYAQKALREFGPGTGIIDLYPLELMQHLLEHVPGFVGKVKQGRVFSSSAGEQAYKAKAGEPILLQYEPELRIRGFALKGGQRPGYLFEPVEPPGNYRLVFQQPGHYELLISAIKRDGWLLIEELSCEIAPGDAAALETMPALVREREAEVLGEAVAAEEEPPAKEEDLTFHFPKRI